MTLFCTGLVEVELSAVSTVGTVILAVVFVELFAVKVATVEPFFWMVSVALLTVGIVGVPVMSLYAPEVATAAKSAEFAFVDSLALIFDQKYASPFLSR